MSPLAVACLVTLGSASLGALFFLVYQWGGHNEWRRAQEQREAIEDLEAEEETLADLRLADEASEPASWTGPGEAA